MPATSSTISGGPPPAICPVAQALRPRGNGWPRCPFSLLKRSLPIMARSIRIIIWSRCSGFSVRMSCLPGCCGPPTVAFVGAHGHAAAGFESIEGAFDGVALLIRFGVELRWPSAVSAAGTAVADLVGRLGNHGGDPASPQVIADHPVRIRFVAQQPVRSGSPSAPAATLDPQLVQQQLESRRVMPPPSRGHPGQRATPPVGQQVQLRGKPTPRAAQRLPILLRVLARVVVLFDSAPCGAPPATAAGGSSSAGRSRWAGMSLGVGDGPPPRADEHE
jgi:hypothetical protein